MYLDNAATSRKKCLRVLASALWQAAKSANAGRGGHRAAIRAALCMERTRDEIRNVFFDGTVVFTKNCTEGVNLALRGLPLSGQVVTTVYDHNAVLRTLKDLEDKKKIRMCVLRPKNGSFVEPLKEALQKGKTSLVVVTSRSNVTGEETEIETLASVTKRYSSALFMADLSQSAGHDTYSYRNVDIAVTSGHKGLGGLQGSGFLLFRNGLRIHPLLTGGTGTGGNSVEIPLDAPEALEAGTQNAIAIISLYYALRHAEAVRERVNKRIARYADVLVSRLKTIKNVVVYPSSGGIVLFNVVGMTSGETGDKLSRYGVYARAGFHCAPLMHRYLGTEESGAVRISFGENNRWFHALYAAFCVDRIAKRGE